MRILHASSTSTLSGANRYCFDIAAGQKDLGHDPVVVMPAKPGLAFEFARKNISHKKLNGVRALSFYAAAARLRPDIIHCHDGTVARWLRWMPRRPPSLITLHIRFKPAYMMHFDGVHVLADWQKAELQGYRGEVAKINNWAPDIRPPGSGDIARSREAAGAQAGTFLIAYVGRLEHVKGVDLLIDAFRSLAGERLRLAIVGVGKDEAELRQRAAGDPRVFFAGFSNTPAAWYSAADLVAMPSRREPFALVALEAMACSAPILSSDVDGFNEIFRNDPDCLVPTENASALAARISEHAARKSSPGIPRKTYDMARFQRPAGIAAVTRFYDAVLAARRKTAR